MKKIPYGLSDFGSLKREDYYYVDKTPYIAELEGLGSRYHFFLRPRRFGKSLLISTLTCYYDIEKKDQFETLFGDTWIGQNPTPMQNSLPVLSLDFSGIQTHRSDEEIENSFNEEIWGKIDVFLSRYDGLYSFPDKAKERILSQSLATDIINNFFIAMNRLGVQFYLFIDEYDNFANNILIHSGEEKYRRLTHQGGFLRSFFAAVKKGTASGTVSKLFVTGVSPLVLSDVTSGMNIGDHISFDRIFNGMAGFTQNEVEALLDYYTAQGALKQIECDKIRNLMQDYYNNYAFCEELHERVYNSDMVLSFFNKYLKKKGIPSDLIDPNIRTDYGKLRYLLVKNRELNGNFDILKEIVTTGQIDAELSHSFAMDDIIEQEKFKSFLYYLGLLTIKEVVYGNKVVLTVPNEVIRTMHHEYIRRALEENFKLNIDISFLSREFDNMAFHGQWRPLFQYILDKLYEAASLRDFIAGEAGIKMYLLAYLGLSPLYISESEPEMNKGYADIFLRKNFAITDKTAHEYLIELKYLPSSDRTTTPDMTNGTKATKTANTTRTTKDESVSENRLNTLREQAAAQLETYGTSRKISCPVTKIVIICSAGKLLLLEEAQTP